MYSEIKQIETPCEQKTNLILKEKKAYKNNFLTGFCCKLTEDFKKITFSKPNAIVFSKIKQM